MKLIHFKPLTEADLNLLFNWFQKPHVKQWYARGEHYSLDMIKEQYLPRILHSESIPNFIIYNNEKPIGYIQLYCLKHSLPDGVSDYSHPLFENHQPEQMAGVDLFIAEEDYLHKGYATSALNNFINEYVKGKFVMFVTDPLKTNKHAIHFFERNGFKKLICKQSSSMNEILVLKIAS